MMIWIVARVGSGACPGSLSLASELVALNETLQPQACVGDCLYTSYGVSHMQEVRLHEFWNIVPKEYCGGPELSQGNLVFRFSRMNVHGCSSPANGPCHRRHTIWQTTIPTSPSAIAICSHGVIASSIDGTALGQWLNRCH
jgi:hypothetical protein